MDSRTHPIKETNINFTINSLSIKDDSVRKLVFLKNPQMSRDTEVSKMIIETVNNAQLDQSDCSNLINLTIQMKQATY